MSVTRRNNLQPLPCWVASTSMVFSGAPLPSYPSQPREHRVMGSLCLHTRNVQNVYSCSQLCHFLWKLDKSLSLYPHNNGSVPRCFLCGQVLQEKINHRHTIRCYDVTRCSLHRVNLTLHLCQMMDKSRQTSYTVLTS